MEALKIVKVNTVGGVNLRIADLNAFQEDIKVLTEENYQRMKAEILEDGFSFSPHVFADSEAKWWILDGHQRKTTLTRMEQEGYEIPTIMCMEVEAESLEHARRLVLAAASTYGTFKVSKLVEFTKKSGLEGTQLIDRFVMPAVNLKKLVEVSAHFRTTGDSEVEPPLVAKTKLGQIFKLGEHRLMCGNSRNKGNLLLLLGNRQPDITFTSPPYNADAKIIKQNKQDEIKGGPLYKNLADALPEKQYLELTREVLSICVELSARFVFWNVNYNANSRSAFLKQIVDNFENLEEVICWNKKQAVALKYGLTRRWEPIFVFRGLGHAGHLYEGGEESNVWDITAKGSGDESHRAAFPIELPTKAMELVKNVSSVLDPFGGTGTTLIAAEVLNKKCFMMEISPHYCDAIIQRWEKLSGKKAELLTE